MNKTGLKTPEDIRAETKNWTKTQKLQHVLSKFKKAGKEIHTLNRGGCAIIAYGIVEYSKIVGLDAKVLYLFDKRAESDYNRLRNKSGNGSCSHAVVHINGKLYDSEGEFQPKMYFGISRVTRLELSQEQVRKSIAYHKHWNPTFNRRVGKKQIQAILGIPIKIKTA